MRFPLATYEVDTLEDEVHLSKCLHEVNAPVVLRANDHCDFLVTYASDEKNKIDPALTVARDRIMQVY